MILPVSLKKAEKTLSELYSECIQAAGDEVLRGTNDWTSLQQTKLIPSSVVASFLETQKKELKKIKGVRACDCSHCPKEACWWLKKTIKKYVKLEDVLAVLGEKRKTKGDDEE